MYKPSKTEEQKVLDAINELTVFLTKILREFSPDIVPVGSTAMATFLPGDCDIDIFVVTPEWQQAFDNVKSELEAMKIKGYEKHGALKIWSASWKGFDVDFVFVHPESRKTQTLHHQQHYSELLTSELKDEIRKLKTFLKSRGVYGAEVGGITGIAITELVVRCGSAENVLKFLSSQTSKPVVCDPTKKGRNLFASVEPKRWRKIKSLKGLTNGHEKYRLDKFLEEHEGYKVITFPRGLEKARDHQKASRAVDRCSGWIENQEREMKLKVDSSIFIDDKIYIALLTEPKTLPSTYEQRLSLRKLSSKAIDSYFRAHPNSKVKGDIVTTKIKRSIINPLGALCSCIEERMK